MSRELDSLLANGKLSSVAVQLGPRDQVYRRLYWTAEFETWCRQSFASARQSSLATIPEQLNQAFADFISGRPMTGMTRCDPPSGQAIWKPHTPDLRLFGWVDEPQCVVLAAGELARVLKSPGPPTYTEVAKKVVKIRKDLGFKDWIYGEHSRAFPAARR